jgi:Na+-driven multidrug efflux pump
MTRSINMAIMLTLGVGQGMALLISFYNSSNQNEKVQEVIKKGIIFMVIIQTISTLILLLMGKVLFGAYNIDYGKTSPYHSDFGIAFIIIVFSS